MIPLWMRLKVYEKNKRDVSLWLPLFLVWLLLLPLVILLTPLILLGAAVTWHMGYGKMVLMALPMFWQVLAGLSGMRVEIEKKDSMVFMHFI
jgi:uncharacterized membrane protein